MKEDNKTKDTKQPVSNKMIQQSEKQALEFSAQAERKLRSFSPFNKRGKYEEAADLYIKSANAWKKAKKWKEAAEAFQQAATCYLHIEAKYDAASVYVKAAQCCKKMSNNEECIKYLTHAVDLFGDEGKFSMAAKYQKQIAEMYEGDGDLEKSIIAYEQAAEMFEGEGLQGESNTCLLKVAHTCATLGKYLKAAEIFEKVATTSVDNDLLKWSVKDYLLKAGICQLCTGDVVAVKRALENYCTLSSEFGSTKEYELLTNLNQALQDNDLSGFATHCEEYNDISKLDQWKTNLLVKCKESIGGGSDDSDEGVL